MGITSPTQGTADFQSLSRCLSWQPQIQILTGPISSLATSGSCRWLPCTGEETKHEPVLQVSKIIPPLSDARDAGWRSPPWLQMQLSTHSPTLREAHVLNEWLRSARTRWPNARSSCWALERSPCEPGLAGPRGAPLSAARGGFGRAHLHGTRRNCQPRAAPGIAQTARSWVWDNTPGSTTSTEAISYISLQEKFLTRLSPSSIPSFQSAI